MSILSKLKNFSSFLQSSLEIAIDLGTSNSRVAINQKGIVLREPTYIGLDTKNSNYLFFGNEAKEIQGKSPNFIKVIKPIENGIISDFESNVALVNYFLEKSVFPFTINKKFLKPRLIGYATVPCTSTEVEQKAHEESLLKSGFYKVFLIEKPLASAFGAGQTIFSHYPVLIVDMGGGIIEIAVIALGGIVVQKTLKLGGEYLDRLIYNYLHLKYGLIIGNLTTENLKISLFDFENSNKSLIIRGKSLENGLPKSIRVKSDDVREALVGHFNQIIDMVKDVLESCAPEIINEILKRGIVLTGGLANIKGIDKFFSRDLKIPIIISDSPQDATINGILKLIVHKEKISRILVK
jgi:rod shape-determining protein MreB